MADSLVADQEPPPLREVQSENQLLLFRQQISKLCFREATPSGDVR